MLRISSPISIKIYKIQKVNIKFIWYLKVAVTAGGVVDRFHCTVDMRFLFISSKWPETSIYTNFGSLSRSRPSVFAYDEPVRQNQCFSSLPEIPLFPLQFHSNIG